MSGPPMPVGESSGDGPPVVSDVASSPEEPKEQGDVNQQSPTDLDQQLDGTDSETCVQVAVRVRPMLQHERQDSAATECVDVFSSDRNAVANIIRLGGESGPKFTFDQVFGATTMQSSVYEDRVAPLVLNCLEGYNATVLAYGQTGSGKTHTIMGPSTSITTAMLSEEEREQAGVIPRAIRSIFHQLQQLETKENCTDVGDSVPSLDTSVSPSYEYEVRIQFLEVYGEDIRDLLNPQQGASVSKLSIRDVGNEEPEVVGATEHKVESAEEALLCLTRGMYRRVTGSTAMNETSSRSHAILSVIVEQSSILLDENVPQEEESHTKLEKPSQQHVQIKKSKFNFVDLAGSERQKRTQASGQRMKEGIDINKGLLVLGNVISALGDPRKQGRTFVPYRDSKLTRLLKGSLGGNHKTLMIACVSPSSTNAEETLNCLRYANRAKNIQNHAVVNVDATSALVTDLKVKIQRLADDLMKARTGKMSECSIPLTVIESLARGAEDSENDRWVSVTPRRAVSPSPRTYLPHGQSIDRLSVGEQQVSPRALSTPFVERARYLQSENEAVRGQPEDNSFSNGLNSPDQLRKKDIGKTSEYERQISHLKMKLKSESRRGRANTRHIDLPDSEVTRTESPELSRLKSQMFGSLSKFSTVDAEVEAEERSVKGLSEKYLSLDNDNIDDEGLDAFKGLEEHQHNEEFEEDSSVLLEADLLALTTSISAKEELIVQLQISQDKFESMREFYEEKLTEMETMLLEKVAETEKLSEELQKNDVSKTKGKELSEKLKQKQAQILELRKKQAELTRLTTVASRNESQISRLKDEISLMKSKKVDLQKQIASERKTHKAEVQSLKKEAMKKDRELNKVRREHSKISQEAARAHNVAKTRLDQISHLKLKYKETEKRHRMQAIKHGVLAKAGLNPVIMGRRQSSCKGQSGLASVDGHDNIDRIRDLFDKKVADVSRREHLAMKVAQEWEEHFELSTQKQLLLSGDGNEESIHALESQIHYREDRIRSIASRLGKREKTLEGDNYATDPKFLFDDEFEDVVGSALPLEASQTAANVLFGMVVRERRRIASLARTASELDEKVQAAETAAASKDAAFRAYVDEQRLEAASLAQNQQEHILSLMEMVKESPEGESPNLERRTNSGGGNSKLLVLANERIAVLERQLDDTNLARDAIQKHREREESARILLVEKNKECEELEEEIDELRSTLRHIREEVGLHGEAEEEKGALHSEIISIKTVRDLVANALHPSSASLGSKSRRRRSASHSLVGQSPSMTPKIRRDAKVVHSSDSEETPDWADDIMADLAIIAEGKIPASLLESQAVIDSENQLNGNVFDRLTDPESFTGVQKQKTTDVSFTSKGRSSFNSSTAKRRELTSQQVAESLGKSKKRELTGRKLKEKRASKSDHEKRSVFDRLLSPSNLTGTQKQKFHYKKGRDLEKAIENLHVSTRAGKVKTSDCENESDPSEGPTTDHLLDDLLIDDVHSSGQGERRTEQTNGHQNVFERLSRTTTAAYAEKQNINIAEKLLDDLLHSSDSNHEEEPENPKCELKFERLEEYQKQDVFERLQRTTTEAYAQKKNSSVSLEDHQFRPSGASPVAVEKTNHNSTSPTGNRRVTRSQSRS